MGIFAQDGSRAGTKILNGFVEGEIEGVVLSLMSRSPENLIAQVETFQEENPGLHLMIDNHAHASVFPETDKHGKIPLYGLYDMNVTAFELQDDDKLNSIVEGTLDLQNNLGIPILTSPSLAMQEFNDANSQISLKMYDKSIAYMKSNVTGSKKLYLTLVFSEQALNQKHSMAQMLDRLSLLDADGFYIIVQRQKNDSGMWSSSDTLASLMYLVNSLHGNEYEIIMGYTDLYGILLAAVGADHIASGWFQTLRQYSRNFYVNSSGGPGNALYPSEGVLSSLYINPDLRNIINSEGDFATKVVDEKYGASLLTNPETAPWSDEAYALEQWRGLKSIVAGFTDDVDANLSTLEGHIDSAQSVMAEIRAASIPIDDRHNDRHLEVWKIAIEKYRRGVL